MDKGGPTDIDDIISSTMKHYQELKDHREKCKFVGVKVTCLKPNCKMEFTAGIGDFFGVCGSNQNVELATALKRINKMKN